MTYSFNSSLSICFVPPIYKSNSIKSLLLSNFVCTFVKINVTTMNTRLKQFLAAENITQSQFADKIEVVRASVSHVLSGRNNPSYEFIRSIMSKYPTLNIEWLMFGKGKMYKDSPLKTTEAEADHDEGGLLFAEDPVHQDEPSVSERGRETDFHSMADIEIKTSSQAQQTPFSQRKVKKIIILYDDGSYQEVQEMND